MIRRLMYLSAMAAGLAALSCNSGNAGPTDATPAESQLSSQRQFVSQCRGFGDAVPFGAIETSTLPGAYCDAETLRFRYDTDSSTLTLYHRRVALNCCGERAITVTVSGGVYAVLETDRPNGDGNRCRCGCVFDFAVQVDDVTAGTIPLAVQLDVTDDRAGPREVWSGALDLTKGSGEFVLNTDPVMGCE